MLFITHFIHYFSSEISVVTKQYIPQYPMSKASEMVAYQTPHVFAVLQGSLSIQDRSLELRQPFLCYRIILFCRKI